MDRFAEREVVVYHDITELPITATAFLSAQHSGDLCLNQSWFELVLRYAPQAGSVPRIYVMFRREVETVDCVLFTMMASHGGRPRKLCSLTNFYTLTYAPIFGSGRSDILPALETLARFISAERPAWDIIELSYMIEELATTRQLAQAFSRAGMCVDTYKQYDNWYLPTKNVTAEQYFSSRPSQVRNTITRKTKKARKAHSLDFRLYQSPETLSQALPDYEAIYARSWKKPERHPRFIPQLIRLSAQQGTLRLGIMYVDGSPAAAQIWLITGDRATIYKLAYDEKYMDLSIGSILTKTMFDHVLENEAVVEVDYGIGSEPYKLDWMSDRRHIVGLICFNPRTTIGMFSVALHYAGRLKRVLVGLMARFNPRSIHASTGSNITVDSQP
jgi:hypothetical protein